MHRLRDLAELTFDRDFGGDDDSTCSIYRPRNDRIVGIVTSNSQVDLERGEVSSDEDFVDSISTVLRQFDRRMTCYVVIGKTEDLTKFVHSWAGNECHAAVAASVLLSTFDAVTLMDGVHPILANLFEAYGKTNPELVSVSGNETTYRRKSDIEVLRLQDLLTEMDSEANPLTGDAYSLVDEKLAELYRIEQAKTDSLHRALDSFLETDRLGGFDPSRPKTLLHPSIATKRTSSLSTKSALKKKPITQIR